jgi:hypothetical protein
VRLTPYDNKRRVEFEGEENKVGFEGVVEVVEKINFRDCKDEDQDNLREVMEAVKFGDVYYT